MNDEIKNTYHKSIDFWNKSLVYTAADFEDGINKEEDWKNIGSSGLFALMSSNTVGWNNVLDYGCGTGWMDVILAKNGADRIKAVDVAPNAVESAKLYSKAFDADSNIDFEAINTLWLATQPEATYDYAVCCNVLDVVPVEVAEDIMINLSRVCKPGATVLVTLNPYFTEAMRSREGITYEDPYMYVNGILRVNNHTDDEWTALFLKYFNVKKLEYFKWDAEDKKSRRFYHLTVR